MSLSDSQIRAITVTERITSAFSLTGAVIIIVTFLSDSAFRKPINRLIFYAAWGNIFTNVATLISTDGIKMPGACQFQAFLIQWFMPADALWAFAMACNVYLTFFHNYGAQQLRTLEWKYFLFCYGTPFVPAFVYFFIHTSSRGSVYGSAVLWCWVSIKWDFLRVAVFYGPVWLIVFATFIIYVLCGRVIFRWRDQLLTFARPKEAGTSSPEPFDNRRFSKADMRIGQAHTTDVKVQTRQTPSYTATVSAGNHYHQKKVSSGGGEALTSPRSFRTPHSRLGNYQNATDHDKVALGANRAALNYCRVALLFFIALCVTWIPSSVNRVWTLVSPSSIKFSLNFAGALVLPLQGFWNGIIYITTSWTAVRAFTGRLLRCDRSDEDMLKAGISSPIAITAPKPHSMLMQAVGNIKNQRSNSVARTTDSEQGLREDEENSPNTLDRGAKW